MSALNKFLIFFTLAFLCSSAVAQSTSLEDRDFEGTFQLKNSEALLTLERRSTGMLNGALGTASDKVYFTVSVHGDYAVGEYEYGDSHVEITLQPQPDGNTMFFWLKDASTAEEDYAAYAAVRQEGAAGASLPNTVPAGIDAPESQIGVSPFMRTAADSAPGDLAGTWYALSSPEQGLSILIVLNLAENGSFTAAYVGMSGTPLGWSAGDYMAENGKLTLHTPYRSDEICLGRDCQPFTGADTETAHIVSVGADMLVLEVFDAGGDGTPHVLYVRDSSALAELFRQQGSGEAELPALWFDPCGTSSTVYSDDCVPVGIWDDGWR